MSVRRPRLHGCVVHMHVHMRVRVRVRVHVHVHVHVHVQSVDSGCVWSLLC